MSVFPFAKPIFVIVKPVGAHCNLRCDYCYYLDKRKLYPKDSEMLMSERHLELFIRQYLEAQTQREVMFIWHGGEPLLRGKEFYRKALALQQHYGRGFHIDNCIQTNGTLLDDEWCRLFKAHNFLVGVSIDGPKEFHNAHRGNSFDLVTRGVRLLNTHGVEWNAMAVVNSTNVRHPLKFYDFFKGIGCRFIQFEPIVETIDGRLTPESITGEEWGDFLCKIFDEWYMKDVGEVFIQYFESTIANWAGVKPSLCSLAPVCGQSAAMEHNGDLYSCDHFVFPEHLLGNPLVSEKDTITSLMFSKRQKQFGESKYTALPRQCHECRWLRLCWGECPKNRIAKDCYGNLGLNHLCPGLKHFFSHTAQPFRGLAAKAL